MTNTCFCCPFYSPTAIYKTAPEHVTTFGSCRKLREDIYSINPCNQILSKCPFVEKEKAEFHCGIEESGFHAYNCNDCPNKCDVYYQWDKEMKK